MPFYKVTAKGAEKPQLIEAPNPASALRHASRSHFTVDLATTPDVVALMGQGVKPEKAGEEAESAADAGEGGDAGTGGE